MMMSLRRGFGVGSAVAFAALLSHSQCTDVPSNGTTNTDGLSGGSVDMAMVIPPQDPPSTLAITSVNPPRLAQDQATTLAIGGTGFKAGATVTVGGVTCAGPIVSQVNFTGTLITCAIPTQLKTCGLQNIVVTNPDATTVSNDQLFLRHPAAPAYAPRASMAVGAQPDGIVVADVDGDGKQDLVYAQRNSNNIAVRLGVGDGTFAAATTYGGGGSGPIELAVADFTGDNKLDIAVANSSGSVGVLVNSGTGTFGAAKTVAVTSPHGLAVGDVNGDGKLDVVVSNQVTAANVFIGDGTGTLVAATPAAVGVGANPLDLALGDVNGDGKLDMLVTNFNDKTLSVRLGNGNGTFSNTNTVSTNAGPVGVAVADLNGDKNLDVVVANQTAGNASIFFGDGTGGFAMPVTLTTGNGTRQVAIVDLNRDGLLDLAFTNSAGANVGIYLGNGQGTFAGFTGSTLFTVGNTPYGIATGDFNGDGNRDFVTTDFNGNTLSVMLATEQCK